MSKMPSGLLNRSAMSCSSPASFQVNRCESYGRSVRYRKSLTQQRIAEVNRIQKVLEGANIKLASVATDIMGVSGRAILAMIVAGQATPQAMADLVKERLRQKLPQLQRALNGRVRAHQRFILAQLLAHMDFIDKALEQSSQEIAQRLSPFEDDLQRLCTIPGVKRKIAELILAEIGTDMNRFPPAKHLASWAALCPGNCESVSKRYSGKTRKGSWWLTAGLVDAAQAAARTRNTVERSIPSAQVPQGYKTGSDCRHAHLVSDRLPSPEPENDLSRTGQQLPRPATARACFTIVDALSRTPWLSGFARPVTANSSLV